jgi:3-dehydrosphinganine reductase
MNWIEIFYISVTIRDILIYSIVFAIFVLVLVLISSKLTEKSFDCKKKHVLITGGSSGIGLETAKEYIRLGAHVSIVARNTKKLKAAMDVLEACKKIDGQKLTSESLDVSSNPEEVTRKINDLVKRMGNIAVLVNCAGTSFAGEFDVANPEKLEYMLNVNVLGSAYPTHAALKSMKAAGQGGRVIFVASQVAQVAIHGYAHYAASKWALRGLAEAIQMEVKPHGIYVSVCYPPDTDTPGYEEEMKTKPDITKLLSESGSVFQPAEVARDLVWYSGKGYSHISTGLDGWLLKMLHPGMGPVNNIWETAQPIFFAPLARIISLFYVVAWDNICLQEKMKKNKKD